MSKCYPFWKCLGLHLCCPCVKWGKQKIMSPNRIVSNSQNSDKRGTILDGKKWGEGKDFCPLTTTNSWHLRLLGTQQWVIFPHQEFHNVLNIKKMSVRHTSMYVVRLRSPQPHLLRKKLLLLWNSMFVATWKGVLLSLSLWLLWSGGLLGWKLKGSPFQVDLLALHLVNSLFGMALPFKETFWLFTWWTPCLQSLAQIPVPIHAGKAPCTKTPMPISTCQTSLDILKISVTRDTDTLWDPVSYLAVLHT